MYKSTIVSLKVLTLFRIFFITAHNGQRTNVDDSLTDQKNNILHLYEIDQE